MLGELAPCTPSPGKSPLITWGPDANRGDIEALIDTGVQFHRALQGMAAKGSVHARLAGGFLGAEPGRAHATIADAIAMDNAERGVANAAVHAESASKTIYQWRRDL